MNESIIVTGDTTAIRAIRNLISELQQLNTGKDVGLIKALDLSPEHLNAFMIGLVNSWHEQKRG